MGSPAAPAGSGTRILVVDDEPDIRTFLVRILERVDAPAPVAVEGVANAAAAVAALEAVPRDLVLSDYRMPGRDGVSLLAEALARWPSTRRVLMTAYRDDDLERRAVADARVAAVVRKPMTGRALVDLVGRVLREPPPPATGPPAEPHWM